jgi:hypothetical protein
MGQTRRPKLVFDRAAARRRAIGMRAKHESRALMRTFLLISMVVLAVSYNLWGSFGNGVDYSDRPLGSRLLSVRALEDADAESGGGEEDVAADLEDAIARVLDGEVLYDQDNCPIEPNEVIGNLTMCVSKSCVVTT